jgi:hypothetical protein
MPAKPWLRDYLKRLALHIERNEIANERELSATVELSLPGWSRARSLLEALGYTKDYVRPQYPIQIGTSKPRVDFLLGKDTNTWMLDLKRPGERCDRAKHVGQIQSYLGQEKVVLGILFSGTWALAYINPEHSFVSDFCEKITDEELAQIPELDLKNTPVVKVSMSSDNTREMVHFLQMFRCDGGLPDIRELSRKLAGDYIKRIKNEGRATVRSANLSNLVLGILQNPNEELLQSIISISSGLQELRATPKEILKVWPITGQDSK